MWKLRWIDINCERRTVAVSPTKNHNSRTLPVSANLLSRLLKLPRKNEWLFASQDLDRFRWRYERARDDLAVKLENSRIHIIALKSLRYWKATMEYHKTKDILHVQWLFGHKRLSNTLVYTHLVNFESNDYVCKVAKTVDETNALIECGFEYVTEIDGVRLSGKESSPNSLLLLLPVWYAHCIQTAVAEDWRARYSNSIVAGGLSVMS